MILTNKQLAFSFLIVLCGCSTSKNTSLDQGLLEEDIVEKPDGAPVEQTKNKSSGISDSRKKLLLEWCHIGITAACIDYIYFTGGDLSPPTLSDMSLEEFCEKGNSSACYYLSEKSIDYGNKACELNEMRSCQVRVSKMYQSKPPSHCKKSEIKKESSKVEDKSSVKKNTFIEKVSKELNDNVDLIAFCYTRKIKGLRDEESHLKGKVTARFHIDLSNGRFQNVTEQCSDFHDAEISKCVIQSMGTFQINITDFTGKQIEKLKKPEDISMNKSYVFNHK